MGWHVKKCPKTHIILRKRLFARVTVRDGPLENLSGGAGEVQKKYSGKGKLNEKKFLHAN